MISPATPVQRARAPLSGEELERARKRFSEAHYKRYGERFSNPVQVAMTSIGLSRAELVERFKVECPKWASEPSFATPERWSYNWEFLYSVTGTFHFSPQGRVIRVEIAPKSLDFSKRIGEYQYMADHLEPYIPWFAYERLPDDQGVRQLKMRMDLVKGYLGKREILKAIEAGTRGKIVGFFWLVFKNPKDGTYVTINGIDEVTSIFYATRKLDTESGVYKNHFDFFFPKSWEAMPLASITVSKSPGMTSPPAFAAPLTPPRPAAGLARP